MSLVVRSLPLKFSVYSRISILMPNNVNIYLFQKPNTGNLVSQIIFLILIKNSIMCKYKLFLFVCIWIVNELLQICLQYMLNIATIECISTRYITTLKESNIVMYLVPRIFLQIRVNISRMSSYVNYNFVRG